MQARRTRAFRSLADPETEGVKSIHKSADNRALEAVDIKTVEYSTTKAPTRNSQSPRDPNLNHFLRPHFFGIYEPIFDKSFRVMGRGLTIQF